MQPTAATPCVMIQGHGFSCAGAVWPRSIVIGACTTHTTDKPANALGCGSARGPIPPTIQGAARGWPFVNRPAWLTSEGRGIGRVYCITATLTRAPHRGIIFFTPIAARGPAFV